MQGRLRGLWLLRPCHSRKYGTYSRILAEEGELTGAENSKSRLGLQRAKSL